MNINARENKTKNVRDRNANGSNQNARKRIMRNANRRVPNNVNESYLIHSIWNKGEK